MSKISAIIITKDEEGNIRDCLRSLTWVDELIVVDSGSTDMTGDICREYTDSFHIHEWKGFGQQKNVALDYATSEWVLSIDADERVSDVLRDEIQKTIKAPGHDAYAIPRLSSYCGQFIRHGGWRPDHVIRLFRRETARFSDDMVHEKVLVDGTIGQLENDLLHYSFRDLEQVLTTVNKYSTLGARQKHLRGEKSGLIKALLHGFAEFVNSYLIKGGFLDGKRGLMLAISNAEGTYYKYLKLMLLDEEDPN